MLKYYESFLHKVILLNLAHWLFFSHIAYAANKDRGNSSDYIDQLGNQNTYTSNENQASPSGCRIKKLSRPDRAKLLTLSTSLGKTELIIQKENELKDNYSNVIALPKQPGHHWNLSEISDTEAVNVCYSLWTGLVFSEINEISKDGLPPLLYPFCKSSKYPIEDIGASKTPDNYYFIVYPNIDKLLLNKHPISVLKCVCRFTYLPNKTFISNNSQRYFYVHKFKNNEYFVLSPISKHGYKKLAIIDVQKIDPDTVNIGDKRSNPVFTN